MNRRNRKQVSSSLRISILNQNMTPRDVAARKTEALPAAHCAA